MPFGGKNSIFRKPGGTGRGSVNGRVKDLKKSFSKLSRNLVKETERAFKNVRGELNRARDELTRPLSQLGEGLIQDINWVKGEIEQAAQDAKEDIDAEGTRIKRKLDQEANKAKKHIEKEAKRLSRPRDLGLGMKIAGVKIDIKSLEKDINRELTKAKENIDRELTKIKTDIDREATKLKDDFEREVKVATVEIDAAVKAATVFIEKEFSSTLDTLSDTGKLLAEGKIVDAIWIMSTSPIVSTSENLAAAAASSKYLNQVATIAASAYGGPSGAAAYAAWLTYETTGSLDAALRAGVANGIASYGSQFTQGSSEAIPDAIKNTLVKASTNAAAVAASGGSQRDIEQAFMSEATELRSMGQKVIQQWVVAEYESMLPAKPEIDFDDPVGISIIESAKELHGKVQDFKEKWEEVLDNAEQQIQLQQELVKEAVENAVNDIVEGE